MAAESRRRRGVEFWRAQHHPHTQSGVLVRAGARARAARPRCRRRPPRPPSPSVRPCAGARRSRALAPRERRRRDVRADALGIVPATVVVARTIAGFSGRRRARRRLQPFVNAGAHAREAERAGGHPARPVSEAALGARASGGGGRAGGAGRRPRRGGRARRRRGRGRRRRRARSVRGRSSPRRRRPPRGVAASTRGGSARAWAASMERLAVAIGRVDDCSDARPRRRARRRGRARARRRRRPSVGAAGEPPPQLARGRVGVGAPRESALSEPRVEPGSRRRRPSSSRGRASSQPCVPWPIAHAEAALVSACASRARVARAAQRFDERVGLLDADRGVVRAR